MPKRESYIRIRLFDEEKEEWKNFSKKNKFSSLSQFIRYVISEYIERDFSRISKTIINDNLISKTELLKILKEERRVIKEERDKYFKMFNEIIQERSRLTDIKVEDSLKDKILKWLEKFPNKLRSEDIADLISKSEPDTLDILNKMMEQNLIKLNKNMKYELINNGEIK